MIKIHKAPEPEWFPVWKKQSSRESHGRLSPPDTPVQKNRLMETLVDEQGGLCCYCGRDIGTSPNPDPNSCHLEHFRPQSKYHDLATEYGNIHASCNSKLNCGHHKKDDFDEDNCISPLEVDEERFVYTLEGEVCPKDQNDEAVVYMIKILNLNHEALMNKRKNLLTIFQSMSPPDLSLDEIKKLRSSYQERDANHRHQAFRQVLTYYIDNNLMSTRNQMT
jgi:uncharacterized protein (TIGR02646 family)